ncbi:MAG: PHP domain-containing protein, partial [Rhodothermales bacterium]
MPRRLFQYMDVRRADLHTHTTCSDGKLTPSELIRKVHSVGIRAVAVTDHDSIDGYAEAHSTGLPIGVEVVTGVELSVTFDDQELHLLGYFFDPQHADLTEHLRNFRLRRMERAVGIIELLNKMGLPIRLEDVLVFARDGVVGRPHLAQALVSMGLGGLYDDAFGLYLKDFGPAFVPKPIYPAADAIALLHDAGGISSLAHPGTRVGMP